MKSNEHWIAPNATVQGDVEIGHESSIWFGAVVRGDTEAIRIGQKTNIQDLCCLHGDPGIPCVIGDRVTIGHGAIVHGARVEDNSLIGMGAIVLNNAVIGEGSIVAAGSLVTEGKVIPPGSLALGTPAKVVRQLTEADKQKIEHGWQHYVELARQYRTQAAGDQP